MWLFDTVALSESAKPRANEGFLDWLDGVDREQVHTSALVIGEIRRGIDLLAADSPKRAALRRWLDEELLPELGDRVHPVDTEVAQVWGRFGVRGKASAVDALIGATALVQGLTVVTRNARDFDGLGVAVVNPWT